MNKYIRQLISYVMCITKYKRIIILSIMIIVGTMLYIFASSADTKDYSDRIYQQDQYFGPFSVPGTGETPPPSNNNNFERATYIYQDEPVNLENGETLLISVTAPTTSFEFTVYAARIRGGDSGQPISYGYICEEEKICVGTDRLYRNIQLNIDSSDDIFEYAYITNHSSDTIHDITVALSN